MERDYLLKRGTPKALPKLETNLGLIKFKPMKCHPPITEGDKPELMANRDKLSVPTRDRLLHRRILRELLVWILIDNKRF